MQIQALGRDLWLEAKFGSGPNMGPKRIRNWAPTECHSCSARAWPLLWRPATESALVVRSGQIEPVRSNLRRNSKPILISLLGLVWLWVWQLGVSPYSTWLLFFIFEILVRIAES